MNGKVRKYFVHDVFLRPLYNGIIGNFYEGNMFPLSNIDSNGTIKVHQL